MICHFVGLFVFRLTSITETLGHFFPFRTSLDGIYQSICLPHEAPSCQFFTSYPKMSCEYRTKLFCLPVFQADLHFQTFFFGLHQKDFPLERIPPLTAVSLTFIVPSACNSALAEIEASIPSASPLWTDEFIRVPSGGEARHSLPEVRIRTVCAAIFIVAAVCHSGNKAKLYNKAM